jgi:hypothetical protein
MATIESVDVSVHGALRAALELQIGLEAYHGIQFTFRIRWCSFDA